MPLHLHHGIEPIMLIDEYESPVLNSLGTEHARVILEMVKLPLSGALENSDSLRFAAMAVVRGGGCGTKSDPENRNGRIDAVFESTRGVLPNVLAVIRNRAGGSEKAAMASAEKALKHIHRKGHCEESKVDAILHGIAFAGKSPCMAMDRITL